MHRQHDESNRTLRIPTMCKRIALSSVLAAVLVVAGAAQNRPVAMESRGPGWLPWYYSYNTTGLTAAERTTLTARASAYERLFVTRDSLARPQGFRVESNAFGGLGSPGRLGQFGYRIIFFEGMVGHEGPSLLWAYENVLASSVRIVDSGPADFEDSQGAIYRERPKGAAIPGLPPGAVVFGGLSFEPATQARENMIQVLLTSDGELPWSDVSRERMLNLLIAGADAAVKKDRQALSQTTYQRWLSDAAKRKQETEQMLVAITAVDKSQAATTKAELERVEKATGESLKQNDAAEREQLSQTLAADTARLTKRRSELAAMSQAERAAAAWVPSNSGDALQFTAPGASGSSHLIADKPDYYRIKGSRLEVRSLLIGFRIPDYTWADRAVTDSYKAFDWAAAARMLAPAAK
jgi:hypothetical protein